MGIKPWHRLSLLVLAGAVLTGCTSTNPRDPKYIESKGPPISPQANQKAPAFPTANGNVTADPFKSPFPATPPANGTLVNQQKPLTTPTSGVNFQNQRPITPPVNNPDPFGSIPRQPQAGDPLVPNQGVPTQSSFTPPQTPQVPQMPVLQPMQPSGQVQLPTSNYNGTIQGRTELFNPQMENRPTVPAPGNFGR